MRLVIGAPHGRSGKSTVTLGLITALRARGMSVQPFKKGPDYIDPSWLSMAAGRSCRNLDLFFVSEEVLLPSLVQGAAGADITIVEGAMGLFDGYDLEGNNSTAAVAKAIQAPVILVIDASRMTRSAAALVQGFMGFDPDLNLGGVILNRVARPRHEDMLRRAIEEYTPLPVLGALPKCQGLSIADRHLGLIPAGEMESIENLLFCLGDTVTRHVDLDRVLSLAAQAPLLNQSCLSETTKNPPRVRIGVVKDHVFSFYYPENFEALEKAGAELVFIDSTASAVLPVVDALYIGGGFPEIYAQQLEANVSLRTSIRRAAASGMPVYAECGGLMYLARRLHDGKQSYEMAGVLPCETRMSKRPLGHGYSITQVDRPNFLFEQGMIIRGHEFHHSCVLAGGTQQYSLQVQRGYGCDGKHDGIVENNVFASYCHIYAPACPEWAANLVAAAGKYHHGAASQIS